MTFRSLFLAMCANIWLSEISQVHAISHTGEWYDIDEEYMQAGNDLFTDEQSILERLDKFKYETRVDNPKLQVQNLK